jgi:hypothetical protein
LPQNIGSNSATIISRGAGEKTVWRDSRLSGKANEEAMTDREINQPTPDFSTLSTALRGALKGRVQPSTLAAYQDVLVPRLEDSRSQLRRVEVPSSVLSRVLPMIRNTEALFDQLGLILELVDEYLDYGTGESLEEAISLLDGVQDRLVKVF